MAQLAETIRRLVLEGRYVIGEHAAERLEERGIMEWQVVAAMDQAKVLKELPKVEPNPSAEFEILLPDGVSAKAVWSWIRAIDVTKLVTVHFMSEN